MSKDALARVSEKSAGVAARYNLTPEQFDVIRSQIAPADTPNDVLELFLLRHKQLGADPFGRLFNIIPRSSWNPRTKQTDQKWSIEATIDGFRATAELTGEYDGQDEPRYDYDKNGKLVSATVIVYRKNMSRGVAATAFWDEYAQKNREGDPTAMWAKMPRTMLAKCAEALAIRKAFPTKLHGLYTSDEMGQTENVRNVTPATVAAPTAVEGEYVPPAVDFELAKARKAVHELADQHHLSPEQLSSAVAEASGGKGLDDLTVPELRAVYRAITRIANANKPAGDVSARADESKPVEATQTSPEGQQRIDPGASPERKKLLEAVIEFAAANDLDSAILQEGCGAVTAGTDAGVRYNFETLNNPELQELLVWLAGPPR